MKKNWQTSTATPPAVTVPVPPPVPVPPQSQPGPVVTAVTDQRAQAPESPARELPPQMQPDLTWHGAYLEALIKNGGQKTAAINHAGVTLKTLSRHRDRFPDFAAEEAAALKLATDVVESEAKRRAIDGVECTTTIVSKDGSTRTYTERKYSDQIMLRLLERLETGSWRQKQQLEHSGAIGGGFKTKAERQKALQEARRLSGRPGPVEAINSRS